MKKLLALGILLVMLSWAACGRSDSLQPTTEETTAEEIFPSDELLREWALPSFSPYCLSMGGGYENPIDPAYWKKYDETYLNPPNEEKFYLEFTEIWKAEMEHALTILRGELAGKRLNELNESQKGWEAYEKNDSSLGLDLKGMLASGGGERLYGPIYYHKNLLVQRYRALQLIEYCYAAMGDYDYAYQE